MASAQLAQHGTGGNRKDDHDAKYVYYCSTVGVQVIQGVHHCSTAGVQDSGRTVCALLQHRWRAR